MTNKKSRNYVNGPKLHAAIQEWYESGAEEPPKIIIDAITQICERLATKNNFKNYTYIDEMMAEGLLACVIAVQQKKYDPYRWNNPFAYFTKVAWNEFISVIKKEHRESYIKHKALEEHMIDASARGEVLDYKMDDSGRLEKLIKEFEDDTEED